MKPRLRGTLGRVDDFLYELDLDPDTQLERWLADARAAGLYEPEAMALATATTDGRPSVRMVLLKGHDERGLSFFTNRESRKAEEFEATGRAAVVFSWPPPLQRQVRVEGAVERLDDEASSTYFGTRGRGSQLGAWASPQSRVVADRAELDARLADAEARFPGDDIPLPPFWGGYRIVPDAFEFWQGRPNRLHDRIRYERGAERWSRVRLGP